MITVLITGTDAIMCEVLGLALGDQFAVFLANNEEVCLKMFTSYNPALIIIDSFENLQQFSALLKQIRAQSSTTKILVLSSHFISTELINQVIAGGADYCLAKPVDLTVLINCIEKLLGIS